MASKISPIKDEFNVTGIPRLLYNIKFDDGAESYDLDTEDIMLFDQYQAWLQDLEQYYSLPIPEKTSLQHLTKHTRVHAKWIDPTDPELYGSWISGKVLASKCWKDADNRRRFSYHVVFDNGDQDTDIRDSDIVPEDMYTSLLEEKMNREMTMSGLSGFDLIVKASKISSPVEKGLNSQSNICSRNSDDDSEDNSDEDIFMDELRCMEVLKSAPPTPSKVSRLSSTPSPDVHYGIYVKRKPLEFDLEVDACTTTGLKPEMFNESAEDSFLEDFRCAEVLESVPPSPRQVSRLSRTPSPEVHYGIYLKLKPWLVEPATNRDE